MRNGSGLNYKPAKGRVDKQERQEKQKKKILWGGGGGVCWFDGWHCRSAEV